MSEAGFGRDADGFFTNPQGRRFQLDFAAQSSPEIQRTQAILSDAWRRIGFDRGIQGNLDGAALLGPWERAAAGAEEVLRRAGGRPGHIFNLGHGVLPETDPADLRRLVELVHERTLVPA